MKIGIIVVLGLVLLAAVGFGAYSYGVNVGTTQAQNIRTEFFQSRTGQGGAQGDTTQMPFQPGQQGQRAGGTAARNATNGTVKSVQGNTIQVTLRDGSTVTVNVDAQTVIQQTVNASVADIKSGENITVLSDQTGSNVTARTIQLRPAGQGGQ
jgi:Cu/Ag efflux protein CusF